MARRWAPLAAAVSVVAIAVAVSLVVGRSSGSTPPVLRLASGHGSEVGVAADAPLASGSRSGGSGSFELVGTLPSGPSEARAHPLPRGAADVDDVRRLAKALGIADAPKRVDGGWQAGLLNVRDDAGNPWSMYAGCGPDLPVSSDGATVTSCASGGGVAVAGTVTGSSGSVSAPPLVNATLPPPPSPVPTVDVDAARTAAKVLLEKLGLADADVSVQGGGEHAFVQAAPRVAGLRTSGYDTSLEIDADGKVFSGNGFLGRPSDGATYPLIAAKAAYDALPELPRPMYLCPATSSCPQPAPVKITGAELGLMLTPLADDTAALLPAWLFTIEGWTASLAQAAIEPRYLQLPKPVGIEPGAGTPVPAPIEIGKPAPAEPPQQSGLPEPADSPEPTPSS